MTELEATGRELEKLYRCALGLTVLLEDLTPGDAIPERQWFLVHQLLQELTDSADSARWPGARRAAHAATHASDHARGSAPP